MVLLVAEPNRKPAQLPGGEAREGEVGDAVLCAELSQCFVLGGEGLESSVTISEGLKIVSFYIQVVTKT